MVRFFTHKNMIMLSVVLTVFASIASAVIAGGTDLEDDSAIGNLKSNLRSFHKSGSSSGSNLISDNIAHRQLQEGENPAITTIINADTSLTELCWSFQTLVHAKGFPFAPVIVFSFIDLLDGQMNTLRSCTPRQVSFVDIKQYLDRYPEGWGRRWPEYDMLVQTHVFVTYWLWEHPAIAQHDVLMQIADDTCFTYDNPNLPGLDFPEEVYHAQVVPGMYEIGRKYTRNLYNFAFTYMSNNNLTPSNPELWANIVKIKDTYNTLPMFLSEFEVTRKSFMLRPDVIAWHKALTQESFGYFEHGWTSNAVRYLTLAIFGEWEQMSHQLVHGFVQKDFLAGNIHPGICRPDTRKYEVKEMKRQETVSN